jgi:hypothetical protein
MNNNDRVVANLSRVAYRIICSTVLACALMWLVTSGLSVSHAAAVPEQTHLRPQAAFARFDEPVILRGSHFPAFSGMPLNELVVYAYRGGEWAPIPFQIDEVNISGTYVTSDDGLLGNRDELVFMAGDVGDSADATVWPADPQARLHSRYAITISDPLSASQQAWVYLYRSAVLTRSHVSYVTWTQGLQTASALSYTAAFSPTRLLGLADLRLNGGLVDVLDRQKIRIATQFLGTLNEEFLATLSPGGLVLPITGPVRAAVNNGALKAAFYGSQLDFDVTFDLSGVSTGPQSIRVVRLDQSNH